MESDSLWNTLDLLWDADASRAASGDDYQTVSPTLSIEPSDQLSLDSDAVTAEPTLLGYSASMPDSGPSPVLTVGDPVGDTNFWHEQEAMQSCAVAAQRGVIEAVTGQCISEQQLATYAYQNGWYDPGTGTHPMAVGNLLEACNIPVERSFDNKLETIYDALLRGERVIVGLDANEINHCAVDHLGQPLELPDAGHAVWVTGIEIDAQGGVQVVLNDPGHPGGCGARVPVAHFENAWDDFGHFAVVTQTQEVAVG